VNLTTHYQLRIRVTYAAKARQSRNQARHVVQILAQNQASMSHPMIIEARSTITALFVVNHSLLMLPGVHIFNQANIKML
jgi:hypothetical protein